MRRSLFVTVLIVVIAGLMTGGLIGCGGGDGARGGLKGAAGVPPEAARPVVGLLLLDSSSETGLGTDTIVGVERSSGGWQDKPFTVPWPRGSVNIWSICCWDDSADRSDGQLQTAELIGFCDYMLVRSQLPGKFSLVNPNNNYAVVYPDASAASVSVYIAGQFSNRSVSDATLAVARQRALMASASPR